MGIEKPKLTKIQLRQKALRSLKIDATCPACRQEKLQRILPFPKGEPPEEDYILNYVLRMNTL